MRRVVVSSHNSSPAPPRETWAERGGLAVMHNAAAAGEAVQSHRREKRPPGKGACCCPRHTPRMFHGTGALPLPSRREPSSCSQRSNGEPCPPSGRLRGFRGMEMARHLTSLLERSSWPVVSRSAEACLASGVPGSSVSTSTPPSPPIPAPDVPGYNSRAFVHTFALAVRNINAQVDLQLSAAHQCRLAC